MWDPLREIYPLAIIIAQHVSRPLTLTYIGARCTRFLQELSEALPGTSGRAIKRRIVGAGTQLSGCGHDRKPWGKDDVLAFKRLFLDHISRTPARLKLIVTAAFIRISTVCTDTARVRMSTRSPLRRAITDRSNDNVKNALERKARMISEVRFVKLMSLDDVDSVRIILWVGTSPTVGTHIHVAVAVAI